MNLGLTQQLILEMIGEFPIGAIIDQAFNFQGVHFEVVVFQHLLKGHHDQFFQFIFRKKLFIGRRAAGHHEDFSIPFGNPQIPFFKSYHP